MGEVSPQEFFFLDFLRLNPRPGLHRRLAVAAFAGWVALGVYGRREFVWERRKEPPPRLEKILAHGLKAQTYPRALAFAAEPQNTVLCSLGVQPKACILFHLPEGQVFQEIGTARGRPKEIRRRAQNRALTAVDRQTPRGRRSTVPLREDHCSCEGSQGGLWEFFRSPGEFWRDLHFPM